MFRALWGPFVSAGDINLSDNVLGNAVSEAQKSHSFHGYTVNGKNAERNVERNAEIIGRVCVHVQKWRDYIAHISYFAQAYKYIVSLIFQSRFCLSCCAERENGVAAAQSVTNEMNNRMEHLINQNVKIETVRRFVGAD